MECLEEASLSIGMNANFLPKMHCGRWFDLDAARASIAEQILSFKGYIDKGSGPSFQMEEKNP